MTKPEINLIWKFEFLSIKNQDQPTKEKIADFEDTKNNFLNYILNEEKVFNFDPQEFNLPVINFNNLKKLKKSIINNEVDNDFNKNSGLWFNGKLVDVEDLEKHKKRFREIDNNQIIWRGVVSFEENYLDKYNTFENFDSLVESINKNFLNYCKSNSLNPKNLNIYMAFHINSLCPHFHICYFEEKPEFFNKKNGELMWKQKGMMNDETNKQLKADIELSTEKVLDYADLRQGRERVLNRLNKNHSYMFDELNNNKWDESCETFQKLMHALANSPKNHKYHKELSKKMVLDLEMERFLGMEYEDFINKVQITNAIIKDKYLKHKLNYDDEFLDNQLNHKKFGLNERLANKLLFLSKQYFKTLPISKNKIKSSMLIDRDNLFNWEHFKRLLKNFMYWSYQINKKEKEQERLRNSNLKRSEFYSQTEIKKRK